MKEEESDKPISQWLQATRLWDKIDTEKAADKLLSRYRRSRRRGRVVWSSVSAAAAMVLLFFLLSPDAEPQMPTPPEGVILVQSDGKRIEIDGLSSAFKDSTGIATEAGEMRISGKTNTVEYSCIMIPNGMTYRVVLSDGTTVWLNSGSSLRFPTSFTGETRSVELHGEACFCVTKDPDKPFLVRSGEMELRVIGTVFNVKSYPEEDQILTTLAEGIVELKFSGDKTCYRMKPDTESAYNRHTGQCTINPIDATSVLQWREGIYHFNDQPLSQILTVLERLYNCTFENNNDINLNEMFHLIVRKDEPLHVTLQKLTEVGGFAYEINDDKVYLKK